MAYTAEPNSALMVPMKLDALFVPATGLQVVDPLVDFSKLPYTTIDQDNNLTYENNSQPYISETVRNKPLSNKNHQLEAGMHLHWALPDALTHATHHRDMKFPEVPNRWLVVRKKNSSIEAKWMVVSDYLWPVGTVPSRDTPEQVQAPRVAYHHQRLTKMEEADQVPFRYLGYVVKVDDLSSSWFPEGKTKDDFVELTTIGYGEPLFAAFYPNCMGVFGLCDSEITAETPDLRDISYEVYGWYDQLTGQPTKDILAQIEATSEETPEAVQDSAEKSAQKWLAQLEEELDWTLDFGDDYYIPEKTICYAKVSFTDRAAPPDIEVLDGGSAIELSIGNTNTEALSAFLANKMSPANEQERVRIENQLECLHFSSYLAGQHTDLGPVFEEARHTAAFHPISGGHNWTLKTENAKTVQKDQLSDVYRDDKAAALSAPPLLAQRLHDLNFWHEEYHKSLEVEQSLQYLIFSDWQKYMHAAYHAPFEDNPDGTGSPFPDIDLAKDHIKKLMALLEFRKAYTGRITQITKHAGFTRLEFDDFPIPDTDFKTLLHLVPNTDQAFINWCIKKKNYSSGTSSLAKETSNSQGFFYFFSHNILIVRLTRALKLMLDDDFDGIHPDTWPILVIQLRLEKEAIPEQDTFTVDQVLKIAKFIDELIEYLAYFPHLLPSEAFFQKPISEFLTGDEDSKEAIKVALGAFFTEIAPILDLPMTTIEQIPAPRYWEPREPVVLLAGPAAKTTDRYGMDGTKHEKGFLSCKRLRNIEQPHLALEALQSFLESSGQDSYTETNANPWHALFFEWELRVDPRRKHNNVDPEKNNYNEDFLTSNYTLVDTKSEFTLSEQEKVEAGESYFIGRSILTPFAQEKLQYELENTFLSEAQQYLFNQQALGATSLSEADQALLLLATSDPNYRSNWLNYFETNKDAISIFHDNRIQNATQSATTSVSPLQTAKDAYEKISELQDDNIYFQSQSLSGFNQALLMLNQTYQLEIAEPNGFNEYRVFSADVAKAVGGYNLYSGLEEGAFHPFRTGRLHFNRIRLVDSFGRTYSVIDQTVDTHTPLIFGPERMNIDHSGAVDLAPRITQPARLDFRWLSANENDVYTNSHPYTSPICGWVLVNHLDASLMVYAGSGEPLGYIEQTGHWRVFPGRKEPLLADAIENDALRKMVLWLIAKANAQQNAEFPFIELFANDLEAILANIAPDSSKHHTAKSLLMGRPLALVRAAVDIHLLGWPAFHQGLSTFKKVVEQAKPYSDDAFPTVDIPVRIGERQRLNDGLVCYWMEEGNGYKDNHFFAPFGPNQGPLKSFEANQITFQQALNAPAQKLSILMDPRGLIHCTTGILPTKALEIPAEFVTPALERLQISFLSAPLLSVPRNLTLALPEEAGYSWAWLQQEGNQWKKLTTKPAIRQADVLKAFEDGATLWSLLQEKAWVELQEHDLSVAYLVKPKDRIGNLYDDAKLQAEIETTLFHLASSIELPNEKAHFGPSAMIREGWLTLMPIQRK